METTFYTTFLSPFGPLGLAGTSQGLTHLDFQDGERPVHGEPTWHEESRFFADVTQQLTEYFHGTRRQFHLRLAPAGTAFQQHVWQALQEIPFGTTMTYQALAQRLGKPGAARAVGHANGRNPLAIVIPCHRLIGSDGQLHGYASGLPFKRRLLQHEGVQLMQRS